MAEYSPTDCSTAVRSAVVFSLSQRFAQQLFLCHWILCAWLPRFATSAFLASGYHVDWICNSTEARDWIHSGCPVVGREKLATGFPNDWLDQTMSYQLIQTTSFAMHPRLIEYNAFALVWMYKLPAGPRSDTRFLCQPALEELTRSAWTDSPRRIGRNEFPAKRAATATTWGGGRWRLYERGEGGGFSALGTNQYNQDLGLIHSTNGNHLESPNEGSSIDHQVTIYLHAQNITMFPTNETWYFASQILVSNSGGLILILTAQSTRNMFRIHSDN
ncbi:putative LRR receptor-like serine/threonine-protein kinase [Dorcoceras hygrometricum]|uniref:Putative LRR receptor-like serine/threonine-protein kinase n=1 Tax=Dorcoceras hygrometricum TaxID=472368 RepID=A0A2Z7D6E1_9LAMI|nr:putative LRR receptor-like serine/threonine-protein kinase [Dorcoceras hygrometricum]